MQGLDGPWATHWPTLLVLLGGAIGLVASGAVCGFYLARRTKPLAANGGQRETMLQLLSELESWAHQYSGDVSQHQALLDSLSQAVAGEGQSPSSEQVVALLQKVVRSNNELKRKLSQAETQLDQKSQQIKWYLTEARTDALTGLANRREFDQQLEELFAAHRRGGRSFVIALVDIDHFKSINDSHGHPAGDRVLKEFADALHNELAEALIVSRFGGEEFAVILPGPLRAAAEQMNSLRGRIASRPFRVGQSDLRLTISAGLSEPGDDMGAASMVRRADEALYAAKHIGRNRVYFHDGREPTLVDAPEVVS